MKRPERARWRSLQLVAWALLALVSTCKREERVADGGSETHFLLTCDAECGPGLVCRCGVCTQECSEAAECSPLASAAGCFDVAPRVARGSCGSAEKTPICDASCLVDGDCADLGEVSRCLDGFCRDAEAPTEPEAVGPCEPPRIAPSELVVLGDSLIQLSGFTSFLEQSAASAGMLAEGEHYRDYASAATSFLTDNSFNITTQYEASRAEGPARVVVLDGGATDMLQYPCSDDLTEDCPAVRAAVDGAEQLFSRMAEDGVEHVVYFFYPNPRNNQQLQAGLDVLRPLVRNACGRTAVACHFIDLRPAFADHDDYLGLDGIVFSESGAQAAASAVWERMEARCIPR